MHDPSQCTLVHTKNHQTAQDLVEKSTVTDLLELFKLASHYRSRTSRTIGLRTSESPLLSDGQ